jgi:CheY-like chemotaxis protein
VNAVIIEIEKMLKRIMRENIELRTVLDPELGNIRADPGQVEQVLMNLAVNARDAMPDGGRLTVETRNVDLTEQHTARHLAVSPGAFVRMTVTDTGVGIPRDVQAHIFEPFFTTKAVGKGTGLGLSTVYGIIKQSGGDIDVYSEVGHGTTFKIYLPCVDENVQRAKWTDDRSESLTGTETILVVEDEGTVRSLVREILEGCGYRVLEAAGGHEALSICEAYTQQIHLLLTDVIMPKMGGVQLSERVKEMLPDIRTLFMSGYTDDSITDRGLIEETESFIEKPFTPDELSSKVRSVLDA